MAEMEEPQPKRRRGRTLDQKAHNAAHLYSTIQSKLKQIVNNYDANVSNAVLGLLKGALIPEVTKLYHELYLFTELDLMRRQREHEPWPTVDQNYYSTVLTVLTGGTAQARNANAEGITKTFSQHYQQCRPVDEPLVPNAYRKHLRCDLAKQAATSTRNHVVMNIANRMKAYVKRLYNENEPGKFIGDAFSKPNARLRNQHREFKAWVVHNPFDETTCAREWVHFHEKLFEVNNFFLERAAQREQDGLPKEKSKTFHMVPKKQGFAPNFVPIHKSTLPEILKLLDKVMQQRIIELLLAQFQQGDPVHELLQKRLVPTSVRHAFFTDDFHQNEVLASALWRLLFKVEQFETVNRKFAYGISTDGYSASISMQKPKPQGFVDRAEVDFKYDLPPHGRALHHFQRIIGIDPGRTYTATAYDGERTTQVSNKEIRRRGKVDQFQVWERRLRKREPEYGANLAALPTLKVNDFELLKQNITTTLARSVFLFRFCADKPFRKWRFKRQLYLNKAYYTAVRKILDEPEPNVRHRRGQRRPTRAQRRRIWAQRRCTLVGYGDYSNQDGTIRGTPKSGVKRLKRALRSYGVTVVMVDEFRTSKTCSACHCTVENVSYRGVRCHEVVRCQNTVQPCRIYWQRDFNAARNIRSCFMNKLNNEPRPLAMTRGAQ